MSAIGTILFLANARKVAISVQCFSESRVNDPMSAAPLS